MPTFSELDNPWSGDGLTTRRASPQSIADSKIAGIASDHDDDLVQAGTFETLEHVLEDRPAFERSQELAATEPRAGTRCEHDGGDPGPVRPGASHPPMLAHPSNG